MGFLSRVHAPSRRAGGDPTDERLWTPTGWMSALSQAGIRVTPELAMTLSALWAGVTFLAKNVGSLPCYVLKNLDPEGRAKAKGHPLYHVLLHEPNAWQTAIEFWEMAVGHITLRGNFYAEIVPGPRGFADQLIPRHPDRVTVSRLPNGRLQYALAVPNAPSRILTQDEMFHVRGFSSDGVSGLSVVAYGANSFGAAIAAETFAGRFFKTGASAALAAKHPGVLGEEGQKNLRQSINSYLVGLENVGGVLILEEGMSIDKIGIDPQQAQLLPTREHAVREVARWLGIPSYVLSDGGKPPTYASAYQYALDLVTYSFTPLARRIEERIVKDLILASDLYVAKFDMKELLRGDLQARAQFHHLAIMDGWKSRNEVRLDEDMNPETGLDTFLEPQNMRGAGDGAGAQTSFSGSTPGAAAARRDVRATMLALEAAGRVVRKEIAAVRKLAERHAGDGQAWAAALPVFYEDHARFLSETLHISLSAAREYCGRQGLALQASGFSAADDWEATVPPELALLVLDGDQRAA